LLYSNILEKKHTYETANIDVVVMNNITQKPETGEQVILVKRKDKFTVI